MRLPGGGGAGGVRLLLSAVGTLAAVLAAALALAAVRKAPAAAVLPSRSGATERLWALPRRQRAAATSAKVEGGSSGRLRPRWLRGPPRRLPRAAAVATAGLLAAAGGALPAAAAQARPFSLFGLGAAELLHAQNLSLFTWALLLLRPRWKQTPRLALLVPVLHSLLYALLVIHTVVNPTSVQGVSFDTLKGIQAIFRSSDGVLAGWLHYCVFDPLVGLGEVLDAKQQRVPHLLVMPCLLLTMFVGPVGFLAYLAVRSGHCFARERRRRTSVRAFLLGS